MAVNLCAAHKKNDSRAAHKVSLACFLQSCSTRRWISCSARNRALVLYTKDNSRVTREFGPSNTKKYKNICVLLHMSVNLEMSCTVPVATPSLLTVLLLLHKLPYSTVSQPVTICTHTSNHVVYVTTLGTPFEAKLALTIL